MYQLNHNNQQQKLVNYYWHTQTKLKARNKPTTIQVIPILQYLDSNFLLWAPRITQEKTFERPREYTTLLAQAKIKGLDDVYYEKTWCAALFSQPDCLSSYFMQKAFAIDFWTWKEVWVRNMSAQTKLRKTKNGNLSSAWEEHTTIIYTLNKSLGESKQK